MSGINTGILTNAHPLSVDRIKELETEVLNGGGSFAYLDENSKLCFAMHRGVDSIKELAWDNAYELTNAGSLLTKRAYKKTGLKTFALDKTFIKSTIADVWELSNNLLEYDGSLDDSAVDAGATGDLNSYGGLVGHTYFVKVSDRALTYDELSGSTLCINRKGVDEFLDISSSNLVFFSEKPEDSPAYVITNNEFSVACVYVIHDDSFEAPYTKGTYFMLIVGSEPGSSHETSIYTKSISCLTTATAERLEGDGQEFYTAAPSTLSFRSTAPLSEFQDVQINGQTVDPSNYTLEEGSTIVKLSYEYLKTLDVGQYELSVVSNSKTVKGDFTVAAPELNEHGFYYNVPYFCETYNLPNPDYSSDPDNNEEYIWGMSNLAVVFMADGSVKKIDFGADEIGNADEVFFENGVVTFYHELLCFTGRFSEDGKAIVTDQVYGMSDSFLDGYVGPGLVMPIATQNIAVDDNYFYLIHDDYAAFGVLDNTKSEYPKVKSYVYDKPVCQSVHGTFSGNTQLTNMQALPDTYSFTAGDMFSGCTKLASIDLSEGLTYIEAYTFRGCSALTKVILPSTLEGIGMHAFLDCVKLSSISFNGTIAQWNNLSLIENWNQGIPATYVQCSDGTVTL